MPTNIETPIIISDTSCLIALTNINCLDVLKQLYETILITPEVANEYGDPLPAWIKIKVVNDTKKIDAFSKFIDIGESSAIALAMETTEAILIIDDKEARQFALSLGLKITGTLGILIRAHKQGVVPDLSKLILQLRQAGFHLPENIDKYLP